jgi:hypothetical protein
MISEDKNRDELVHVADIFDKRKSRMMSPLIPTTGASSMMFSFRGLMMMRLSVGWRRRRRWRWTSSDLVFKGIRRGLLNHCGRCDKDRCGRDWLGWGACEGMGRRRRV